MIKMHIFHLKCMKSLDYKINIKKILEYKIVIL